MKNKKFVILIFLLLTIYKILITSWLPMFIESGYRYDDKMMIDMASSLIDGNWLGFYSEKILTKGIFYPLFIAFLNFINIPYLFGLNLFYTFSTIFFCYSIKDFFKNKIYVCFIYLLLLFEPISYSLHTFQRIYRNSIGTSLILILLASFLMLYKYKKIDFKKTIIWSLISGIALSIFFFTREDTMWVFPFITIILLGNIIYLIKNNRKKMILFSFLPFLILFFNIQIVSYMNYKHYGIYTVNELTNSSFAKTYKKILSIEQSNYPNQVSVPKTTLDKIRDVSPTFNSIADNLYKFNWDQYGNGEILDGYLFWGLRDAASKSGYYKNSKMATKFWNKVGIEIDEGLVSSKLKQRNIMSSIYISPYRVGYFEKTINTFFYSVKYITEHQNLGAINKYSGDKKSVDNFEKILNDEFSNLTNQKTFEDSVKASNVITKIYKFIFPIISMLGLISYIILVINFFKERKYTNELTFLTAIFLSYIALLLGVSYTHISAFNSVGYYYLAPAYVVQLVFCLISLFLYIENSRIIGGKHEKYKSKYSNALFKRGKKFSKYNRKS